MIFFQKAMKLKRALNTLVRRLQEVQCLTLAAALAYNTLLALVPTLALMLVVLGRIPYALAFFREIDLWLLPHFLPRGIGARVSEQIYAFSQQAGLATLPGTLAMLATAFLLLESVTQTFDRIWRHPAPRPLRRRLWLYLCTLFIWPVLIGMTLALFSWILSLSLGVMPPGVPMRLAMRLFAFLLPVLLLSLLYWLVPAAPVRKRHAALAGLFAAFCFSLVQYAFEVYITRFSLFTSLYGALALIPIFLIWLYCAWLIVLAGAFMAARLGGR
jgi:membrane protein